MDNGRKHTDNSAPLGSDEEVTGTATMAELKEQAREEHLVRAVVHEVVAVLTPKLEEIFAPKIRELTELVGALTAMRDDMGRKQAALNQLIERCPRLQSNGEDCTS